MGCGGLLHRRASLQQFKNLFFRCFGQYAVEVCCESAERFLGRAVALAGGAAQLPLGCGEQRPAEAVLVSVLVGGIDKIFGNNVAGHLQAGDKGVELAAHFRPGEAAGRPKLACYHAAVHLQGGHNGFFNAALFQNGCLAAPPVVEVGPPVKADKPSLSGEKLAINASAVLYHRAFPRPERPLPAAVVELHKTALLGHQPLGAETADAAVEQRQKPQLADTLNELGARVDFHSAETACPAAVLVLKKIGHITQF